MKNNNGEGSGYYDKDRKRYIYKITIDNPLTGKKERKSFYSHISLKEAKIKYARYMQELEEEVLKRNDITLIDWLREWIKDFDEGAVKKKTYERYKLSIEQYVAPYDIGNISLRELKPEMLQKHFKMLMNRGGMSGKGLAPRTVNALRTLLLSALRVARDEGLTDKNFDRRTKAMVVSHHEMHILTEEEAAILITAAKELSYLAWCVIVVALGTGMRLGEIFGLHWDSVNLERKTITVRRSLVTTSSGNLLQNNVKTMRSYRTIDIPDNVVNALKEYRKLEEMLGKKVKDVMVFTRPNGNCYDPANFSYRIFKNLVAKVGISKAVRFHDLRHTHATMLLAKGVNIKVISERLGHSSIRITLDTYSHVVPSMQDEAIKALDEIFSNKKEDASKK